MCLPSTTDARCNLAATAYTHRNVRGARIEQRDMGTLFLLTFVTGGFWLCRWVWLVSDDLTRMRLSLGLRRLPVERVDKRVAAGAMAVVQVLSMSFLATLGAGRPLLAVGAIALVCMVGYAWVLARSLQLVRSATPGLRHDGVHVRACVALSATQLLLVPLWACLLQHELSRTLDAFPEAVAPHLDDFGSLAPRPAAARALQLSRGYEPIADPRVFPIATASLMAACAVVYAIEVAVAGRPSPTIHQLQQLGGDNASYLAAGHLWRLVTSSLLHASPEHLAGNMSATALVGLYVERCYGTARTWAIIVFGMVVSAIIGVLLAPLQVQVFVGESGIAFALIGAAVARDPRMRQPIGRMCVPIAAIGLLSSFAPGIGTGAHFGGCAAGAMLGWAVSRDLPRADVPVVAPAAAEDPAAVIERLLPSATSGAIALEQLRQLADAVAAVHGRAAAGDWYAALVQRAPTDARAQLAYGRVLLEAGNEHGLAHVDWAAAAAPDLAADAAEARTAFIHRRAA